MSLRKTLISLIIFGAISSRIAVSQDEEYSSNLIPNKPDKATTNPDSVSLKENEYGEKSNTNEGEIRDAKENEETVGKNLETRSLIDDETPELISQEVRLETLDVENTENSLVEGENVQTVEATDTNITAGNTNTTRETPNHNTTSKVFPKRVKCLPRHQQKSLNDDTIQPTEKSVNEVDSKDIEMDKDTILDVLEPVVHVINGSAFLKLMSDRHNPNVTNRSTPGECSLVIFYAPWCPFSAMAAPNFNGLARLFPDVALYAVDSSRHQSINTQFGILALPTLIIYHNTKPISKFNQSNYMLENFSEFVNIFTGLEPVLSIGLMDQDMEGPMPTKAVPEPDYYLYLAWIFTITCALGYFGKSSYCEWIIESVRNNWREAEIQHEHID